MPQLVTLLTDFGTEDSYVAEMKAILFSQLPTLNVVDITHHIPPFDIERGAFQLLRSYGWFPAPTYHLAVVDPGVGSQRKCLYISTAHGHFIGPDNGVLLWAVRDAERRKKKPALIYEIPVPPETLPTFNGRDVLAPFLANLLRGKKMRLRRLEQMAGREFPLPQKRK